MRHILRTYLILLALSLPTRHVQSQPYVFDGMHTVNAGNPEAKELTLETMAANGYGIWTNSTSEIDLGWHLLANEQRNPVVSSPNSYNHPGIVASGAFTSDQEQKEVKVATNLEGRTRYVYPSGMRDMWVIEGINDQRASTVPERQISLVFENISTNVVNRQVVRGAIHQYASIHAQFPGGTDRLITTAHADYRDRFDISMDASFLYIVWEHEALGGVREIYARAVKLSDGTLAGNWHLGSGQRPTVACNIRNNPANPTFYAAWISTIPNGAILTCKVTNGLQAGIIGLADAIDLDNIPNTLDPSPTHARILVSSNRLGNTTATGVYAITPWDLSPNGHLYFYKFVADPVANQNAKYVAGWLGRAPDPYGSANQPVADKHIRAFANPYDGELTQSIVEYDEFHCLFQYAIDVNLEPNVVNKSHPRPVIIVRGHNGLLFGTDTRTTVNWSSTDGWTDDPYLDNYNGCVNQMGIHVRWRPLETGTHMIGRWHKRQLDEPIEEWTSPTFV